MSGPDYSPCEAVARDLLDETGFDRAPQDAFALAAAFGLELVPGGGEHGFLQYRHRRLTYPSTVRLVRQHKVISHELGHYALQRAQEPNTEDNADWVGCALMMPAAGFDRDLHASAWNFNTLRAKHINCSASLIARRIVQRREAVATVIDQGRVTLRIASPWLDDPRFRRLSGWERTLVDEALAENLTVHGDDLCYAVPLLDGGNRRVVLVCEAEQLSLRL